MQSSTASFCCLLCAEAHRLKCYPLTVSYNYIINHICWYISLTPWIPLRLKTCEWCLCTEVSWTFELGLVCNRNVTWLWDSSAFAGQEDPHFYFLLIMKLTGAREQHSSSSSCSPGRAAFPVLSQQCQGGRADTPSKVTQPRRGRGW